MLEVHGIGNSSEETFFLGGIELKPDNEIFDPTNRRFVPFIKADLAW